MLLGVALAFSAASRSAAGQSRPRLLLHALWRSVVLVFLGIWLRSVGRPQTYFTFEDTLTQIGLGYPLTGIIQWLYACIVAISCWLIGIIL